MRPHLLLLASVMLLCLASPGSAKTGDVSQVEFRLIRVVGLLRLHLPGHFTSFPKGPKPVSHTARLLDSPYGQDLLAAHADFLKLRDGDTKVSAEALASQLHLQHDWDGTLTKEQSDWLADLVEATSGIPEVLPTCPRTDDDCQEAQNTLCNDIEQLLKLSNILKSKHDPS